MRNDLRILCDQHRQPMQPDVIFIAGTSSGQNWNEVYCCRQPGCGRIFHPQYGYFQLEADRKLLSQTQQRRECQRHAGEAQYLRQAQAGEEVWECPQDTAPGADTPA